MANPTSTQSIINQIIPGGNFPANKMHSILTYLNSFYNTSIVDPVATDDNTEGYYALKSLWRNATTGIIYLCVEDTTGAALWVGLNAADIEQVLAAGNVANGYTVEISGTPDNNVSISSAAYTGTGNVGLGNNALNGNTANDSVGIGYAALQGNTGLRAVSLGYLAGSGNKGGDTVSLGTSAARDNEGFFVVGVGYDAAKENIGDYVVALGHGAAFNNTQSNRFVISNNSLPSFADHLAAASAITTGSGASAGNTYLYHNQATNSIGAVRL